MPGASAHLESGQREGEGRIEREKETEKDEDIGRESERESKRERNGSFPFSREIGTEPCFSASFAVPPSVEKQFATERKRDKTRSPLFRQ